MAVITIPKPLRDKLGDEATEAFEEVTEEVEKDAHKELATKADLKELEGKLKLYFLILLFVIILVSPNAVNLISKLFGIVK